MAQNQSSTPMAEFLTTIAGPLSSLGLGLVFVTIALFVKHSVDRLVAEMLHYLSVLRQLSARRLQFDSGVSARRGARVAVLPLASQRKSAGRDEEDRARR